MTEDEIMPTIYEQLAKNKDKDLFQNATRAKTKAQKETEALELKTEEAKNKSISSIYRQLAKIIHPDLEADETIKLEKEELMKQLTAAYENNDLHTLLSLEIQWIQKEENQLSALTDEKLKTYNKIMEEQAEDLKNEIIMLENHPRYNALRHIEDFPGQLRSIDLEGEKEYIQEELKEITANLANLNKSESTAVKAIKKIIKHYAEETNGEDDLMELASMFEQVIQYGRSKKTK
jgi:succinate dehydrogenase flavin-adding protein (antitoxin of CptAB toxin-antitoxin module)